MYLDHALRATRLISIPRALARVVPLATAGVVALAGLAATGQESRDTPQKMTADLLANLALETLAPADSDAAVTELPEDAASDPVRPDQYVRAQVLLDLALEQAPDDAGLLRLRAGLAERLGDRVARAAALTQYLDLRPDDDALRLQLILMQVTELETLDGRLALLERYLADEQMPGRTPALVSRLASAAAAAARELGDEARFIAHLRVAGRQGVANAEAAGLTLALAESRGAGPRQTAAAAINLVRSDPLNATARRVLAERLTDVGVFDGAVQQYEVSTRMPGALPLNNDELAGWVRALVGAGELARASEQLAAWEAFTFGASAPDAGAPPAEVVLLRCVLDGEEETGRAAFERVAAALTPAVEAGDPDAALELAWITALFGPETQPVAELLRGGDAQDIRYLRASGFVYLREGAADWARKAFERAGDDSISAYGLARLTGRDDAGAARSLRQVVAQSPGSFGALLAVHRLHTQGRSVPPSVAGREVQGLMNRQPATLWAFDLRRNPWVGVQAALNKNRHGHLESVAARVTVQNRTDLPLPLSGPDTTTPGPTAVVSVTTYAGGQPTGSPPPIVADLGRRLMLMPGERLTYDLRVDRSRFGLALARVFPASVTFNSTFMVGPEVNANGGFGTGPIGGIDTVRAAQVQIDSLTVENLTAWTERLEAPRGAGGGADRAYFAALARTGASISQMSDRGIEGPLMRRSLAALGGAYADGDARVRAFTLLTLAADRTAGPPIQTLFDQAVRSEADVVRIAHLAHHITDPLDPALVSAVRDGSPRVRRFAEALSEMLKHHPPVSETR